MWAANDTLIGCDVEMGVPCRLWVGGPGWAERSCRASVSLRVLTQCVVLEGEREREKVRTHDERNNGLRERSAFHSHPHPIKEQKRTETNCLPQHRQQGPIALYVFWWKERKNKRRKEEETTKQEEQTTETTVLCYCCKTDSVCCHWPRSRSLSGNTSKVLTFWAVLF